MRYLLIDCQILQTAAFDRGMGKYTLSLLNEVFNENKLSGRFDTVQIILSNNLDISSARLKSIEDFLPQVEKVMLDLPIDIDSDTDQKYADAKKMLNMHIKSGYGPTDEIAFLITAPFFVKFPAVLPDGDLATNMAIIYDLIPYKIWHLQRIFPDEIYMKHFGLMIEADKLFSISNAVKDDLVTLVGIPEEKVINIDGAAFESNEPGTQTLAALFRDPFILMPSGPIIHKNNDRAVLGFERFNQSHSNKYTLVITSNFDDDTKARLSSLSEKVVFSGNISDHELALAYNRASCMLFPSLSEGLGMPILEAVRRDLSIVCSDIPVFTEISSTGFYQFDPLSIRDITSALEAACFEKDWEQHHSDYKRIKQKYTWKRSAKTLLLNIPNNIEHKSKAVLNIESVDPRMGSPAGRLTEQLFARLAIGFDTRIICSPAKSVKVPSYIPSMQLPSEQGAISLILRDKTKLFGRKKVEIVVGDSQKLLFNTKPTIIDRSLSIKSWGYSSESNHPMTIQQIYDQVQNEIVGIQK